MSLRESTSSPGRKAAVLDAEQRTRESYDLAQNNFVSEVGMAQKNDRFRFSSALYEPVSRTWTEQGRIQTPSRPALRLQWAGEAEIRAVWTEGGKRQKGKWIVVAVRVRENLSKEKTTAIAKRKN